MLQATMVCLLMFHGVVNMQSTCILVEMLADELKCLVNYLVKYTISGYSRHASHTHASEGKQRIRVPGSGRYVRPYHILYDAKKQEVTLNKQLTICDALLR